MNFVDKITSTKQLNGAIAQLGERLPCTQEVSGSIPLGSTKKLRTIISTGFLFYLLVWRRIFVEC